jgi:hypothetical protein
MLTSIQSHTIKNRFSQIDEDLNSIAQEKKKDVGH